MDDLKPYQWSPSPDSDWSILVFARTRQEAKVVGWNSGLSWDDYTDCRVRKIKATERVMRMRKSDKPHYEDSPESCCECHHWLGHDPACFMAGAEIKLENNDAE